MGLNHARRVPFPRLEISFSQGGEWKALISEYIGTIPLSGDVWPAAEQSISSGAPPRTAVSSAKAAKVGAAATASQRAPSRAAPFAGFGMSVGRPLLPSRIRRDFLIQIDAALHPDCRAARDKRKRPEMAVLKLHDLRLPRGADHDARAASMLALALSVSISLAMPWARRIAAYLIAVGPFSLVIATRDPTICAPVTVAPAGVG